MIHKNHYVYIERSKSNFGVMLLYVCDILIAKNKLKYVNKVKALLSPHMEMKHISENIHFLKVKN